jgi:tetratricopeptide (TPR) repeat protein
LPLSCLTTPFQVGFYQNAIKLDQYLAVAYFQQGVSNFLIGDFKEALANFNDAILWLRGNDRIDYEQLGLKFRLHLCEVLFNRGLCYIYLQEVDAGMKDFDFAVQKKVTTDHDVIDEAIREKAEVGSNPVTLAVNPAPAKVNQANMLRVIPSSPSPSV